MMRWTNPTALKNFEKAPKEAGLFQIGLMRVQMFDPKFLGRAIGEERTIRLRLGELYEGQRISQITAANRDSLFCRWYVTDEVEGPGPEILKRYGLGMLQQFVWNNVKIGID